ncbi:TIGR03086 family metal-binding protein [Thermoactinospora rubra]|uniref:TIGR03086 family metal-binding protein n=1 Tax=Thermoactinospora rubra TaxID=1088767 RepID=UPI000A10C792|nr:TIGR03086 family metal-binding protein [Thermoactinospora rubra]
MHDIMTRQAERTVALVEAVREDQLGLRTPCQDFDVKALINHLEWVAAIFESFAGKGPMPPQEPYAGDLRARMDRTLAAWGKPEAWEGALPGLGLPMADVARMFVCDLVVHGWDVAVATGQGYKPVPEAVAEALDFAARMAPMGRQQGAFGEPVPVPEDAPALDRLLGLTGRDPAWRP